MVETKNNIGNRQPDSNAGCSKQKGVKNKQTRQLVLWIGALIVGAVLGIFGISWLDGLMNFIATVYTRLFQLLAVPTIALAVITTLASLGNQADTGKIFRHAITNYDPVYVNDRKEWLKLYLPARSALVLKKN